MGDVPVLDTKGLKCPLPVLKAKKAFKTLPAGAAMRILATDPGSVKDFQHFCAATGYTLRQWREADGVFTFVIEKTG